jgi:AcrR family transcriptional regulator
MPRPKQRTDALRDHVLRVAIELLARGGLGGFTTRSVARAARTSTPAVYELFGDKAGLVRGVFFEGFRLLRRYFDRLDETADPRADLIALAATYRGFLHDHPVLSHVMFSRPFADFDPEPSERAAGNAVRELIVRRVARCVDAGVFTADAVDVAHVLVALVQGLAAAEISGRLGTSPASIERRWALAVASVIDGFASAGAAPRPAGDRARADKRRHAGRQIGIRDARRSIG